MPLQQILPTWLALNAANDASASGLTSNRTGDAINAGGLNQGDYFDTTEQEAMNASYAVNGLLHAGRYRRVQVDPFANPALILTGSVGFMPTRLVPELNVITSPDLGVSGGGRVVIFLNAITPGNWGFVQELGIATVIAAAAVGIGSAVTVSGVPLGTALQTTTAAGPVMIALNLPVFQG